MATGTKVIVRQKKSGPDGREFHIDALISELGFVEFYQPLQGDERRMFSELGPIGEVIAEELMGQGQAQVDDIERIAFRPTSLTVYKSPTASWNRVQPLFIEPALKKGLGLDDSELDIMQHSMLSFKDLKVRNLEARERVRA